MFALGRLTWLDFLDWKEDFEEVEEPDFEIFESDDFDLEEFDREWFVIGDSGFGVLFSDLIELDFNDNDFEEAYFEKLAFSKMN